MASIWSCFWEERGGGVEGQKSVVGRLEGQNLSSVGWKVKSLSVSHRWNGRSKVCQESLAGRLGWSFARMHRRKF